MDDPNSLGTQNPPSQPLVQQGQGLPAQPAGMPLQSPQAGVQYPQSVPQQQTNFPPTPPVPQQQMPQQNLQPSVQNPQDMPVRHVPDLTASQQVSAYSTAPSETTVLPPSSSAGAMPPPKKPTPPKSPSSLPKPLLFVLIGFGILFILFILLKVLSGFLGQNNSGKVTLSYWGLWEDNSMTAVLSDFERQHPNIAVKYTKQDPHDYSKTVVTRIQNGTGPDVFRYHVSWVPMLLPSLLPLSNQAVAKSDFQKTYYPVMQQDLIQNGAIYGIPLEIDTLALFINKKMFDDAHLEVPTTWDSFIDDARKLTQKDNSGKINIAGAAMGTYDNITHAPDIISLLLVQNGVDIKTMTPASNASDALTFYTSFAKEDDNVWDTTLDPSLLAFEEGKLAMYIGYSWDIFAIEGKSPNLQFGVYPVPHLPGRNTTIASYWVEGISSKTKYPQEAMQLMHFLSQKDTLTKLYTLEAKTRPFGEPYPQVELASLLKSNALVYPFVSQATQAQSSFFAADTFDSGINGQMNGYLANAVNSILKDTSAESAVETLTKGVSQILTQYGQQ